MSAEVERLQAQHADAVREKSVAESKSRRLEEKVAALEGERTDLRRQLVEERREANQAIDEAQAAQAEAKLARAEGSLASQRAEEWEARFNALRGRVEKVEDVVAVGDELLVKVTEIDQQGRINLSRKDALADLAAKQGK